MQIHGLQQAHAAFSVQRPSASQAGAAATSASPANAASTDQLELSSEAQQISQAQAASSVEGASSGIRSDKVAALREAIASGNYETEEKLSAALDKLLDTFA